MTDLALSHPAPAWRQQDGEGIGEHLAFLHWALQGGDLRPELASRFHWAERRRVVETYEGLEAIPPGEMATEAAIARVRITLAEIMKLQQEVMTTPNRILDPRDVLQGVEWMLASAKDYSERRTDMLDWSSLTPEERECMLRAKEIQDRLLRKTL